MIDTTFRCGHDKTPDNTMRRKGRAGECLTCHRKRRSAEYMAKCEAAGRPATPRGPNSVSSRVLEMRMVREFRLPPKPKPILSYDPNYGRSYGLAPGRVSSRVERGEK